jgi:hypothetical protein
MGLGCVAALGRPAEISALPANGLRRGICLIRPFHVGRNLTVTKGAVIGRVDTRALR